MTPDGIRPHDVGDDDLRRLFVRLRSAESTRMARAEEVIRRAEAGEQGAGRAPEPTTSSRWLTRAGLAVAAGLVGLFAYQTWFSLDAELDRAAARYAESPFGGRWTSPTAPLMELPGWETLSAPPSLGLDDPFGRLATDTHASVEALNERP